jgi:hypothetical protein
VLTLRRATEGRYVNSLPTYERSLANMINATAAMTRTAGFFGILAD